MRKKLYRFIRNKTQNKFLNALAEYGTISKAAEATGVTRQAHYFWKQQDKAYEIAYLRAQEMGNARIEEEAWRRGVYGDERPVFYKGKKVGTVKHYSDAILALLLKGAYPDKYKDRVEQETVGDGSGQITWEGEEQSDEADEKDTATPDSDTVPAGETVAGEDTPEP